MRALADRLEVKAASLYWQVRDRRELLELLAESILDGVRRTRPGAGWREDVLALGEALRRRVSAQKDADRVLLEVPESVTRSDTFRDLTGDLQSAGLQAAEAARVAMMVMTQVIASRAPAETPAVDRTGDVASIAIDSGSRGVVLRAGPPDMQALIRVPPGQSGAGPAVVRGEQVVVRRLRGVGGGEIELTPRRRGQFKGPAPHQPRHSRRANPRQPSRSSSTEWRPASRPADRQCTGPACDRRRCVTSVCRRQLFMVRLMDRGGVLERFGKLASCLALVLLVGCGQSSQPAGVSASGSPTSTLAVGVFGRCRLPVIVPHTRTQDDPRAGWLDVPAGTYSPDPSSNLAGGTMLAWDAGVG